MPNTLAEVEVKKATATNNSNSMRDMVSDYEEQRRSSKRLWLFAPLALLVTASASFLVVRRWLNNRNDGR